VRKPEGWEDCEVEQQRCIHSLSRSTPPGADLLVGDYKKHAVILFRYRIGFVGLPGNLATWHQNDHKIDRTLPVRPCSDHSNHITWLNRIERSGSWETSSHSISTGPHLNLLGERSTRSHAKCW
jgi:hypothetical protein